MQPVMKVLGIASMVPELQQAHRRNGRRTDVPSQAHFEQVKHVKPEELLRG